MLCFLLAGSARRLISVSIILTMVEGRVYIVVHRHI